MLKNKTTWLLLGIITALGVLSYILLPDKVPMQWGLNGEVSRYGSRLQASTLLPLIAYVLTAVNGSKSDAKEGWKQNVLLGLFIALQIFVLIYSLVIV